MIKYPHRYFHYDAIGNMQCNFMSDAAMDEAKGIIDREGGKIVDADNNVIYPAPKEGTLEEKLRTLREMYNRRCDEIADLQTKLDKLNNVHHMNYFIDNKLEQMSEPVYWHINKLTQECNSAAEQISRLKGSLAQAIKDLNQRGDDITALVVERDKIAAERDAALIEARAPRYPRHPLPSIEANDTLRHGLHEIADKLHQLASTIGEHKS